MARYRIIPKSSAALDEQDAQDLDEILNDEEVTPESSESIIIWNTLQWSSSKMYTYTNRLTSVIIQRFHLIDKVRIALFVTWLWALIGFHVSQTFSKFFSFIMQMPDEWLAGPASYTTSPKTASGKTIKIISASNGTSDMTNKLKLFLNFYWEEAGKESANSQNGFDFSHLAKALGCSVLYCSYILTNKDSEIDFKEFYSNIQRFLIWQKAGRFVKSVNPDLSDLVSLPMRHASFDEPTTTETLALDEDLLKILE